MPEDRTQCPVCESTQTFVYLERPSVAVHQNLVMPSEAAATGIARGRLAMRCCPACGFLFNGAFDQSLMDYGPNYDNTQNCSDAFNDHIDALVDYLIHEEQVQNCRIVEVGCGKGAFLRQLVETQGAGNTGTGFDPTYVGELSDLEGRLTFRKTFYDERAASVPADVVVCRHVIEHVPEPRLLLTNVRQALSGSPNARVYFETPCADAILDQQVIWDFFYEHCSIFTPASLSTAFQSCGLAVRGVRHVFHGQYLWIEAELADAPIEPTHAPGRTPELAEAFTAMERSRVARWTQQVAAWRESGGVALWGAGAKGVTFAHLIDADRSLLDCVVDVNPTKQGKYLPGTGHPIIAPKHLAERDVSAALVLNPTYRAEIEQWLDEERLNIRVIDLMNEMGTDKERNHRPRRSATPGRPRRV